VGEGPIVGQPNRRSTTLLNQPKQKNGVSWSAMRDAMMCNGWISGDEYAYFVHRRDQIDQACWAVLAC
jgi:hypothetical protein